MDLTIRKMQKYLKEKYRLTKPLEMNNTQRYFFRLIEEVGELSEVIRKNKRILLRGLLIYNDPVAYAELILNGDPETYLKTVTEYKPLDI